MCGLFTIYHLCKGKLQVFHSCWSRSNFYYCIRLIIWEAVVVCLFYGDLPSSIEFNCSIYFPFPEEWDKRLKISIIKIQVKIFFVTKLTSLLERESRRSYNQAKAAVGQSWSKFVHFLVTEGKTTKDAKRPVTSSRPPHTPFWSWLARSDCFDQSTFSSCPWIHFEIDLRRNIAEISGTRPLARLISMTLI